MLGLQSYAELVFRPWDVLRCSSSGILCAQVFDDQNKKQVSCESHPHNRIFSRPQISCSPSAYTIHTDRSVALTLRRCITHIVNSNLPSESDKILAPKMLGKSKEDRVLMLLVLDDSSV